MKNNQSHKNIVLFGAGGHAKVIIEAAAKAQRQIIYLLDGDATKKNSMLLGFEIKIYQNDIDIPVDSEFIVTIGNDVFRKQWYQKLSKRAVAGTLIHPSAAVTSFCHIGAGTVVLGNANINPGANIGCNVIINTGAIVEHDCNIGDHSHIAPNATLCGGVSIGECTLIGAGATVIPGIKIGNNVIVGAGSVVIKDVPDNAKVAGNPAKDM